MNFGKYATQRKLDQLDDSTPEFVHAVGAWAVRIAFILFLLIVTVGCAFGYGAVRGIIASAPTVDEANIIPSRNASFIYDQDGNMIQKLTGSGSNRISISIDEIPLNMQHAIVAIEDSRFYEHNGIDPSGIVRAAVVGISSGFHFSEGASTITQQLLKNNVFTDWMSENRLQSVRRKIQEQYLAVQLEKSLRENGQDPKQVILENYLNTINLGSGCYGVQTAAQTYFGKDAKDLTLSECAVLAAIPQAPTKYNPKTNPENNAVRREKVLNNMLEQGYITQEEYDEAIADPVYDRIAAHSAVEATEDDGDVYSYFVDEVINNLIDELMETKGYTYTQAQDWVYSGGLSIYTTQDSSIQQIMDEEFQDDSNFPEGTEVSIDWALTIQTAAGETVNYSKEMLRNYWQEQDPDFDLLFNSTASADAYIELYKEAILQDGDTIVAERLNYTREPQASMVIMDQETGYVKGIVGGRGEKTASLTLDRATGDFNQPGSTFKILAAYGPALDLGKITLDTMIDDSEYSYSDGTPLHNSDNTYHGEVSVLDAIVNSINIPAVKVITEITPAVGFQYLQELGFKYLTDDDIIQPLALGGITNGVTTEELCAAYAAIANGGLYRKPVYYTKVIDSTGKVLIDHTSVQSTRVFKSSTCYQLTQAMEEVVSRGTGTPAQLQNMHVAGKTGTTSDTRDLLFAGYTPYYTAAIWCGYDTNEECSDTSFQKSLWGKVMGRIHESLPDQEFDLPDSMVKLDVCAETGLLPGYNCETVTKYFTVSSAPTSHCTGHYSSYSEDSSETSTGEDKTEEQSKTNQEKTDQEKTDENDQEGTEPSDDTGDNTPDSEASGEGEPESGEGETPAEQAEP